MNIFFIFYIISPVISILHPLSFFNYNLLTFLIIILNSAVNLYLLIRLFDLNEQQKFLNRPATGALTLITMRYYNRGKMQILEYNDLLKGGVRVCNFEKIDFFCLIL